MFLAKKKNSSTLLLILKTIHYYCLIFLQIDFEIKLLSQITLQSQMFLDTKQYSRVLLFAFLVILDINLLK
jgi:hypothetical protein